MRCRCKDIIKLSENIDRLNNTKNMREMVDSKIQSSVAEQKYLKEDSWSASKSCCLKNDISSKLPYMADKIEETLTELISEIDRAIEKMEEVLHSFVEEDDKYHANISGVN